MSMCLAANSEGFCEAEFNWESARMTVCLNGCLLLGVHMPQWDGVREFVCLNGSLCI